MCICCFWLVLLGVIFFFILSSSFRSPASLCALALSLLSSCVRKGEVFFFFLLVCRFAAFMVLHHCLGLDTYTHLEHQQQQQKRSFKLESKNWERAKKKHLCWRLWLRRDADSTSLSTAHRRCWRTSLDMRVSVYRKMHQFFFLWLASAQPGARKREKKTDS